MVNQKDWVRFIKSLLETHYDPSYQLSGGARLTDETVIVTGTTLEIDDIGRLADVIMSKIAGIAVCK